MTTDGSEARELQTTASWRGSWEGLAGSGAVIRGTERSRNKEKVPDPCVEGTRRGKVGERWQWWGIKDKTCCSPLPSPVGVEGKRAWGFGLEN